MSLTDTQHAILALIAERIEADGMPPSQAEIARAFGFKGVRAAQYHLEALEAGRRRSNAVPGRARGIRLLAAAATVRASSTCAANDDALQLPVLGQVAAGVPIGADIGSRRDGAAGPRAVLADARLPAQGAGRLDARRGHLRRRPDRRAPHPEARYGQIVVARIDDEITVKLLKIGKDRIRLLPRNPDYAPIEVQPGQDFAIEGLYCGLVRPNRVRRADAGGSDAAASPDAAARGAACDFHPAGRCVAARATGPA